MSPEIIRVTQESLMERSLRAVRRLAPNANIERIKELAQEPMEVAVIEGWNALRPMELPRNWTLIQDGEDGAAYGSREGLRVILSVAREEDGQLWAHLSCSRKSRVPSYDDLCQVRSLFLGDRLAIQLFVPVAQHVNIHAYCLHLWAPLEATLPDFTKGTRSI